MLKSGDEFLGFIIGQKIGKGQFGEIYSAIKKETGIIWALKLESNEKEKKTLLFEYQILTQIQSSPWFPRLGIYGNGLNFSFYSMEFLGPSLSGIIKTLNNHKLSLSTSLRIGYFSLKAIESFHYYGFIHRDIKPGNLLIREGYENPICLIDYGLSRIYINKLNGKHLPSRYKIGFRGTKAYASYRSHQGEDLSRRDDLISWFYMLIDLCFGNLPWRKVENSIDIFHLKKSFDVLNFTISLGIEFNEIWESIKILNFNEKPNYQFIFQKIKILIKKNFINFNDYYDWNDILKEMRSKIAIKAGTPHEYHENIKINEELIFKPFISITSPFSESFDEINCCGCIC